MPCDEFHSASCGDFARFLHTTPITFGGSVEQIRRTYCRHSHGTHTQRTRPCNGEISRTAPQTNPSVASELRLECRLTAKAVLSRADSHPVGWIQRPPIRPPDASDRAGGGQAILDSTRTANPVTVAPAKKNPRQKIGEEGARLGISANVAA